MSNYAIVRSTTVENIIVWDGTTLYTPPTGTFCVLIAGLCAIGWSYDPDTHTFSPPPTP